MKLFLQQKIQEGMTLGLSEKEARELAKRYGSNVSNVFARMNKLRKEAEAFHLSASLYAQLRYGIEEEMVETPLDFFNRRTSALFFDINWVKKWKEPVVRCMRDTFEWTEEETEKHEKELSDELYYATTPLAELE